MKIIDISTKKYPNTFTKVDDCDYIELSKRKWGVVDQGSGRRYAVAWIKGKTVKMHTEIMGHKDGMMIDHITGETLDNQRHNLRHCTNRENLRNQKKRITNTSGYKGVCWDKASNKWLCSIGLDNKDIHLGRFTCLIKAAKRYDKAAVEFHGEFARVNFPKERQ